MVTNIFRNNYINFLYQWDNQARKTAWFNGKINLIWEKKWPKNTNKIVWYFLNIFNFFLRLNHNFWKFYIKTKYKILKSLARM